MIVDGHGESGTGSHTLFIDANVESPWYPGVSRGFLSSEPHW